MQKSSRKAGISMSDRRVSMNPAGSSTCARRWSMPSMRVSKWPTSARSSRISVSSELDAQSPSSPSVPMVATMAVTGCLKPFVPLHLVRAGASLATMPLYASMIAASFCWLLRKGGVSSSCCPRRSFRLLVSRISEQVFVSDESPRAGGVEHLAAPCVPA